MATSCVRSNVDEISKELKATTFRAIDVPRPPSVVLPPEIWLTILESQCTFPPDIFEGVMLNLIKNPNVTSSHLFRADIFFDSDKDFSLAGGLAPHLKPEYRPRPYELPGFTLTRTIVREMIPRNPQLDRPLLQTCHFFSKEESEHEESIVVYIPHATQPSDLPFYHPAVACLAFSHRWLASSDAIGRIAISYSLFLHTGLTSRLSRTALRLLQTVHKHGQGQLRGYEKRVHLDRTIPQKRYQDTYTRLKAKYGRLLSEKWVEVTDPGKHVFEDIAIAAFLIELWRDMYAPPAREDENNDETRESRSEERALFPTFVDIGCGNGVLTYILLAEGYSGWGFDARERKTWSIFPDHVQRRLQRRLLIPFTIRPEAPGAASRAAWHDGTFAPGTFIISNHADELTAWTPLLAYANDAAFLAIPCCSHDLAGSRFRAPPVTKANREAHPTLAPSARLPQQGSLSDPDAGAGGANAKAKAAQAAETGCLRRTEAQKKMPSAYSTLCSYVASLAEELGYQPETDVLRIPSTRNTCIIGRRRKKDAAELDLAGRRARLEEIVERELGRGVDAVGSEWIERAEKLAKKPGSGH